MSEKKTAGLTPKLSFLEKIGFASFSMSMNVVFNFKGAYYLIFLTNIFGLNMKLAGIVTAIGTVWDAVNDPLIGFDSLNRKFKNGERVRPYILCIIPWAVTVVLIFVAFEASQAIKAVVAIALYFIFEAFNTYIGIPYNSMGAVVTNRDEDRRSLNVYRNIGGVVGTALGTVVSTPLLKVFGALDKQTGNFTEDPRLGFVITAAVLGCVGILGALLHFFTAKERVQPVSEVEEDISFKEALRMLLGCESYVRNILYIACYGITTTLVMNYVSYYATYVLKSTAASTPIMAAYLVVSLIMSVLVGAIDNKLGRRKTMMLGAAFCCVGRVWFILQPFNIYAMYSNAVATAVGTCIAFVMFNTNRNNIVDLIEAKEGRRLDSMVSSIDSLASKLAGSLVPAIVGFVLDACGFDKALAVQPTAFNNAIAAVLGIAPAIIGAIMFFVVSKFHIEEEMAELTAKRTQTVEE